MAYYISYVLVFFAVAFCIVYFALKKSYLKKHGRPMSAIGVIGRTIGIGILLFAIALFGAM